MRYILITILLWVCVNNATAQRRFKVMSYNVLEGFKKDSAQKAQFIKWVKDFQPDMIAFQELNYFTQASFEAFARQFGHPYAVIQKENGYPVGLTSKYPITNIEKIKEDQFLGFTYALVDHRYHVFVVHLDPFRYPKRQEQINTVLAKAALLPQAEPIMIMGDFNNISPADSAAYNLDPLRLERAKQFIDPGYPLENLRDGRFDYSVIQSVSDAGFYDTYNLHYKKFIPTILTKKYAYKIGYWGGPARIDYIWVNKVLKNSTAGYRIIKDRVTDTLSDHYPHIIQLKN